MTATESGNNPREHSEMPAEGERPQRPTDSGQHPQAPAEGADAEQGQKPDEPDTESAKD
ncbi:hypothetical protein [Arthrobacter sp. VKM Ac-2550]|uniref:hypothetical protein n=1 Tax=Crystallibacter permensis TaxID=1938888 RepID=UPI00222705DF|nr:hypothetical protein [Arthrobacter sp. VKM Ac-2550]MCW2134912.1 hypothetical protein [Arthrobacter sp. VKM Ac-2550]